MKSTRHMPFDEVRNVFRVLGHARDLRHNYPQQEKVVLDAMTDLLDADFGHAMQMGEFRPKTPTYIKNYTPGSVQDPDVIRYFSEWGRVSSFDDDPLIKHAWNQQGPVYTFSRGSVMTFEELRPYRIYEEMVEPANLHDVIIAFFRYPNSNVTRQYGFQRKKSKKEFNIREIQLANLFITEMYNLYREGYLEPPSLLDELPGRLSNIAHQLRTGRSQRQIAVAENLSYNTVRSYTKELYDTVGVSSREELVARVFMKESEN